MTKEEAIADLKEALKEVDTFRKIYSRQRKVSVEYEKRYESLSFAINELEQQPKTGQWVEMKIDNPNSIFDGCVKDRRCSVCDYHSATKTKYCPNCGTKMIEPQESEE